MVQGKAIRRLAAALAALVALWGLAWLAVPPLVRWQAPARLSAALGRDVSLGSVDFHPWALEIVLHDLAIGPARGMTGAPLLRAARLRADVALSSIWRRAPVIEAIDVDQARIALTRAPATRSALLKTLYRRTRLPDKPRNVLGLAKDLPDADMQALLASNVAVSDEAMRQQALARAIAVRDALVARGVSADRLFLAAPVLHAAGPGEWTPRATLALSMPGTP